MEEEECGWCRRRNERFAGKIRDHGDKRKEPSNQGPPAGKKTASRAEGARLPTASAPSNVHRRSGRAQIYTGNKPIDHVIQFIRAAELLNVNRSVELIR